MQDSVMSAFGTDEITDLRSHLKELKNMVSAAAATNLVNDISQDEEVKDYLRVLNKTRKMDAGDQIYSKVTLDQDRMKFVKLPPNNPSKQSILPTLSSERNASNLSKPY